MPWTDKNDALDWQSYFHQRNRFVAALLHSQYPRGGRMVQESFNHQIKHLVSMQYSTVALRHKALEDVLDGPGRLHDDLPDEAGRGAGVREAVHRRRARGRPRRLPAGAPQEAAAQGDTTTSPCPSGLEQRFSALVAPIRQLKKPRELSREFPEVELPAMDAKWYRLTSVDSAVVSMPDGTSAALYQRDPEMFRDLTRKTIEIHRRLLPGVAAPGRRVPPGARRRDLTGRRGRRPSRPGWTALMTGSATIAGATPELPPLVPASHNNGLLEVFRRRYLLRLLVRSTVQARYQGTFLGWFWSYLQPAVRFCMYYFVFQILIERGGPDVYPFAIHLVCGMVVVHFFTETFNGGTRSLVSNRGLIVKLPMPRELFPVATMLVAFWHTVPMVVITIFVSVLLGWTPDPMGMLAAVLALLLVAVLGLALALMFSVANVFFRDFSKVTQTLTQFTTFSVPMIYPYSMVAERFDERPLGDRHLHAQPDRGGGAADAALLLAAAHQRPRGVEGRSASRPTCGAAG